MHGFGTDYNLEAVPIVDVSPTRQLVRRICLFDYARHRMHEDQSVSSCPKCCMKRETQILARQALPRHSSTCLVSTRIVEGTGRDGD